MYSLGYAIYFVQMPMSFPSSDPYIDKMIHLDRLLHTANLVAMSWLVSLPVVIGMSIPIFEVNDRYKVIFWLVLAVLFTFARVFMASLLKNCTVENNLGRFEVIHAIVGAISALAISIGLVNFSVILPTTWQMGYTATIAVLAMGTAFTLLYTSIGFFSYVLSLILPIGIAQVFHPDDAVRTLGVMSIIMVPVLSIYYYKQHKVVIDGLRMFYENKVLLERQRAIFDAVPNGIIVSREGVIINANESVSRMFGYSLSNLVGESVSKLFLDISTLNRLFDPKNRPVVADNTEQDLAESEAVRSDGSNFWVGVACRPIEEYRLNGKGIIWSISDLTERKKTKENLHGQRAMYHGLAETANDLVFYLDDNLHFKYTNARGSMRLLGRSPEDLIDTYIGDIIVDETDTPDKRVFSDLFDLGATSEREVNILHADGSVKRIKFSLTAMRSMGGYLRGVAGIATDITPKKQVEDHMLYLAMHDELTGLPNRRLFIDRLQQAIRQLDRQSCQLAVIMLDLDRFKLVNDTLGHSVGDRVLEMTAYRLRSLLRSSDTVARLGGDEFIILLPSVSEIDKVRCVAEKIVNSIGEPLLIAGNHVQIYASVGVSLCPDDGGDSNTLVEFADEAMYKCKQAGCNCYKFYCELENNSQSGSKGNLSDAVEPSKNGHKASNNSFAEDSV